MMQLSTCSVTWEEVPGLKCGFCLGVQLLAALRRSLVPVQSCGMRVGFERRYRRYVLLVVPSLLRGGSNRSTRITPTLGWSVRAHGFTVWSEFQIAGWVRHAQPRPFEPCTSGQSRLWPSSPGHVAGKFLSRSQRSDAHVWHL